MSQPLAHWAVRLAQRGSRVRVRGIPRMLYAFTPWVTAHGTRVRECATGMQLAIDVSDYASCMMLYGRYSQEIVALIERLVGPGDSVIDVGAQLGYLTTILARHVGTSGKVYSFEPDPNAVEKLRTAIDANHLSQVTVLPIAASDHEGELRFNVSPVVGWSTAVHNTHLTGLREIRVATTRIDQLWESGQITVPVKLMKVDVEGLEVAVLDGAQALIAADRPVVIVEINPDMLRAADHTPADILSRFIRHDYVVFRIVQPKGLFSGGEVELRRLEGNAANESCDVVGVPREKLALVDGLLAE